MTAKTLIVVVGQTAIGKTKLAIALAQYFKTEILSADSRQFYKEMTIGTAVPSSEELAAAPHHFIQHKSIFENYSVGDFEKEALGCLEQLFKIKDTIVLVGGSGLYIDAITKGLDDFPTVATEIRDQLNSRLKNKGIEALQDELKQKDPVHYNTIDLNNPHRLIRALEICIGTGQPYSSFLNRKKKARPFNTITIGLKADREVVYERINQRVDIMMKEGLLNECKTLHKNKNLNALQTVGYKELFKFLDDKWELDFAVSEIKKNTRRFAKRQMTWFKKNEDTLWIDYQYEINEVLKKLKAKSNIE
ncbi:tRNA (adenosine(37)-N6)-dimethylallyltransferase MiaA [Aurantibacter crassamenti]|uniref:tRNA (adenosine(37)-N6)-dimethylallyltransferase MiaA n=1 Tax=Aurantibacter crassamenti TaxID=1837375 RepID=UPI00193AABDE|nr:tRNA (adenosine(37)-N6)-dimethylallyltransferase MiaA [Aurantibacter crassamenti]MBM1107488.1 tRNA (adenosine(37)-N6)-dimethylallyltransferase MiaA [Aurantibacter crassamenti]